MSAGYIYFIYAMGTNLVKIGSSTDPVARLRQLQTGSAVKLLLCSTFFTSDMNATEKALHERLEDIRQQGEWFSCEVLQFLYSPVVQQDLFETLFVLTESQSTKYGLREQFRPAFSRSVWL